MSTVKQGYGDDQSKKNPPTSIYRNDLFKRYSSAVVACMLLFPYMVAKIHVVGGTVKCYCWLTVNAEFKCY